VVSAGSARSLLLTVLGEFVWPDPRPVWTSTLLYVLTGLGVEEQTARQAIARGAAAGWIEGERHGREVRWTLTDTGSRFIEEGAKRVYSLGADPIPWDGTWLVLMITIPNSQRLVRKKLYSLLGWAGFGNPTPGLWLTPHREREVEAKRVIDELGLSESTLSFAGSSVAVGLSDQEIVRRAWNLDAVTAQYEAALKEFTGLRPKAGDGVLFSHVRLVNEWQRFPFMDPQLPEALLPQWIGRRAAQLFERRRAGWHDQSHERWRQMVEADDQAA
jgi:phenylacetic acid degradation operon negative regulatory protein